MFYAISIYNMAEITLFAIIWTLKIYFLNISAS